MLAERLKELRKQKKKTQQEVADHLGITRPAYTAYEQGNRNPDYDLLNKLANYFDVTTDYLLGRSKNPNLINYNNNENKNLTTDQEAFELWASDPRIDKFYREFNESSEERKEFLLAVWETLKAQEKK